jgi:Helix-turn-helix domain
MEIGALFNPYKVFQGAFAPFWLLELPKLGSGAKLCYIRLLGFAGKDGRCYPSLDTLGTSLGVSERQARDYVKELERAGLIRIEQRGLRKTNVYLFVWTAEMQGLISSVTHGSDDPDDTNGPGSMNAITDRNNCSAQDRNCTSAPDRNFSSVQDRKTSSVPIGINSEGISSAESSSSSASPRIVRKPSKRTKKPCSRADKHTAKWPRSFCGGPRSGH